MPIPDTPYTRKEAYLNAIATGNASGIPETPYTREEMYLDAIAKGGGGGGGSSTLSGLTDVDISNPTDGQVLVYNATSGKWENGAGGGGGPLLVHFAYDEESDSYPGDKTAGEVLASCQQYGFATGFCDGNTSIPIVIRAIGDQDGIICNLASFVGYRLDDFDSFNPDPTQLVYYYQPNEAITGYYHSIS